MIQIIMMISDDTHVFSPAYSYVAVSHGFAIDAVSIIVVASPIVIVARVLCY